jgi:hypothetical protein
MMQIDVTKAITNYDNTPLLGPDGLKASDAIVHLASLQASISAQDLANAIEAVSVPLTLREVCCGALMGVYKDETELAGQEKTRRWCLARKVYEDDAPDLQAEDVTVLKELIAKRYSTAVVGRAWQMLEGK